MESNKMFKLKGFILKLECFLGVHRFEIVEEYETDTTRNSYAMAYRHVCSTCGCSQDVVKSYAKWDGIQEEITKVWYIGKYNWRNLLRKALVKLNTMFGGMA